MSQTVPLSSHVAKYGMYSKYKPAQEESNYSQMVDLKVYRKEASMKESLLWFVRCLERWKEKAQNCLKHFCLVSDVEPQESQQGKEEIFRRGREREHVPCDGDGDGQVNKNLKRGGRGRRATEEEEQGQRKERRSEPWARRRGGRRRGRSASKGLLVPIGEQGVCWRAGRGNRRWRRPSVQAGEVCEMDGCVSEGWQRTGQGGGEDGRADQTAAVFWRLLTHWAQSRRERAEAFSVHLKCLLK